MSSRKISFCREEKKKMLKTIHFLRVEPIAAVALICQYFLPKHINRLNYTNPKLETATVEVEKVVVTTTST